MELNDITTIRELIAEAMQAMMPQQDNTALVLGDEILSRLDDMAAGHGSGLDAAGGGGSAPAAAEDAGCFRVDELTTTAISLTNCHFMIGGKVVSLPSEPATASVSAGTIVALKIKADSTRQAELATYNSLSSLKQAQDDLGYYIIPLYQIAVNNDEASIACDFRSMPIAAMWEG